MKKEYIAPEAVTINFVAQHMLSVSLVNGNDTNNPTNNDDAESNDRENFLFDWND